MPKGRDYKQEGKTARARGDTKRRALRNKCRREAIKAGTAHKGDGTDVMHSGKGLAKGGPKSCTKVGSRSKNRAHGGRIGSKSGKAAGGAKSSRGTVKRK